MLYIIVCSKAYPRASIGTTTAKPSRFMLPQDHNKDNDQRQIYEPRTAQHGNKVTHCSNTNELRFMSTLRSFRDGELSNCKTSGNVVKLIKT